jgi:hypothetical protein
MPHTPIEIQKIGKDLGIIINIKDNKIIVPDNKKELNTLLRFLAEDIYNGPLTQKIYKTNSKMTETGTTTS